MILEAVIAANVRLYWEFGHSHIVYQLHQVYDSYWMLFEWIIAKHLDFVFCYRMELPLILSTFQRRGWGHVRLLSIRAVPAVQMPVEYPRPEQVVRYRNFAAESSTISSGGQWLLSFPTQNYPLINLIIKPGWLEFLALLHIKKWIIFVLHISWRFPATYCRSFPHRCSGNPNDCRLNPQYCWPNRRPMQFS